MSSAEKTRNEQKVKDKMRHHYLKKLLSLLLCLTLVAGMFPVTVRADGGSLRVECPEQAEWNDNITVSVKVSAGLNIGMMQFALKYNSTALSVLSASSGSLLGSEQATLNTTVGGYVYFSWDSINNVINDAGSILEVQFQVKEGFEGEALITIDTAEDFVACDPDYQNVQVTVQSGSMLIAKGGLVHHEAVAATCETPGNVEYWEDTKTGVQYADAEGTQVITNIAVPPLGHDWGPWTIVKEATETEEGLEKRVCLHDATHVETRVIPKLVPSAGSLWVDCPESAEWNDSVTASVKVSAGLNIGMLQFALKYDSSALSVQSAVSGDLLSGDPATVNSGTAGHIYFSWDSINNVINDEGSILIVQFQVKEGFDGETLIAIDTEEDFVACDPEYNEVAVSIQNGSILIGKSGLVHHSAVPATCEAPGQVEYWEDTETGLKYADADGTQLITEIEIPALGHDWGPWTVTKAATCTEEGEETRVCANDPNHTETRQVEKIPHETELVGVVEPTVEEEGYSGDEVCVHCGQTIVIGHSIPKINPNIETVYGGRILTSEGKTHQFSEEGGTWSVVWPNSYFIGISQDGLLTVYELKEEDKANGWLVTATWTADDGTTATRYEILIVPESAEYSRLIINDDVTEIADYAFANNPYLQRIEIPDSISKIGEHAFDGCVNLLIICSPGSPAEQYAIEHGIPYANEHPLPDKLPETMRLDREHLVMYPGSTTENPLYFLDVDSDWMYYVELKSEDESVATVDDRGYVTAVAPGTTYIVASIVINEAKVYSARCRVDVAAEYVSSGTGTGLGYRIEPAIIEKKATVELYNRNYTQLHLDLHLDDILTQSYDIVPPENLGDQGAAIAYAKFLTYDSKTLKEYGYDLNDFFTLRVKDDTTIEVIPKEETLRKTAVNAKYLKGSYKASILIAMDLGEYGEAEHTVCEVIQTPITLAIKKTLPKVSAKAITLNSFVEDTAQAAFTGERISNLTVVSCPAWLSFDTESLMVSYVGMSGQNHAKTNITLLAECENWSYVKEVQIPVTCKAAAPKLTFKPSSAAVKAGTADKARIAVTVTPGNVFEPYLQDVRIVRVDEGKTASYRTEAEWSRYLDLEYGINLNDPGVWFLSVKPGEELDPAAAHTYKVWLSMMGKEFAVTVKTLPEKSAVTLSGKASGTIDSGIPGSSCIVSLTAKNFNQPTGNSGYYVSRITGYDAKSRTENEITDSFETETLGTAISFKEAATGSVPSGYSAYYAYIRLQTGSTAGAGDPEAKVKLSVKFTDPANVRRSVTLKVKNYIDVVRPGSAVLVTPTVVNCYTHTVEAEDLIFYMGTGTNRFIVGYGEENPFFDVKKDGDSFAVTVKDGVSINHKLDKFAVGVRFTADGANVETKSPANLTVKMGTSKFTQSVNAVTLLKNDGRSSGTLQIGVTDPTLSDIAAVKLDAKSEKLFELREIGVGTGKYAIHFRGDQVTTTKAQTITISVFLKGNETVNEAKPAANGTIKVKINIF